MTRKLVALCALLSLVAVMLCGCGGTKKVERNHTFAGSAYAAKNPYIDNTSANNDLVRALGVNDYGKYTLEVQDDEHPYTLHVRFMYLHSDTDQTTIEQNLAYTGILLLALIGDCEQVNWYYPSDEGSMQGSIGLEYANELLAMDVKEAGKDEAAYTALSDRLFPDRAQAQ